MKKYLYILSVFLVVLVCFLTLTGCKSGVKVKDDGGDMLIQTTEERGIHLSRRNAVNNDGTYTLQAFVMPADATNKKLTWSLECDDENFWDTYDLEDYVKLTVSSDTLSCDVLKLAPCPVQLKIVVTSQANSSVSATCTVDFYKRISDISNLDIDLIYDYPTSSNVVMLTIDEQQDNYFRCSSVTFEDFSKETFAIKFNSNVEFDFDSGTIDISNYITTTIKIGYSSSLIANYSNITGNSEVATGFGHFGGDGILNLNAINDTASDMNALYSALRTTQDPFKILVELTVNIGGELYQTYSEEFTLGDFNFKSVSVSSVDLDESNIIL